MPSSDTVFSKHISVGRRAFPAKRHRFENALVCTRSQFQCSTLFGEDFNHKNSTEFPRPICFVFNVEVLEQFPIYSL